MEALEVEWTKEGEEMDRMEIDRDYINGEDTVSKLILGTEHNTPPPPLHMIRD